MRCFFKILTIFCLGVFGVCSFAQTDSVKKLSIPFLLERGRLLYPDLKKKYHELNSARYQEKDVAYRRLPEISFNFNFNYFPYVYKQDRGDGSSYYFDEVFSKPWSPYLNPSITFSLPVYTFGKISNGQKAAEAQVDMKMAELEETRASVDFNVKKLYWSYLYAESLIKYILNSTVPKYEDLLNERERDFKEGKATRASLEGTRISYYDLKRHQAEADQNFLELSLWVRMLGDLSDSSEITLQHKRLIPVSLKIQPYEYYLSLARQYQPSLKKARSAYDARTYFYEYQKATFYPDIYLAGTMNYLYHNFQDEPDDRIGYGTREQIFGSTGFSFGVIFGLKWNLSFWKTSNQQDQFLSEYLKDLEQIKVAETYQEMELRKSYETLLKKEKILKASEEQFKAARRWLILSLNAYKAGTGSFDDAQSGLTTLFYRKKDYYTSIYEYNLALAGFEQQLGMDLVNYGELSAGEGDDETD